MCFMAVNSLILFEHIKNVLKKQPEMRLIVLSLYYIWEYNIN